jgi:hypothetical protein
MLSKLVQRLLLRRCRMEMTRRWMSKMYRGSVVAEGVT